MGLAAAAHVLERGMTPIVLEAGDHAGHAVRQWRHVQLFSPWEYNVDKAAARLLSATGWNSPDPDLPDRRGIARAVSRTARQQDRACGHIQTSSRVTDQPRRFRQDQDQGPRHAPFEIRYQNGKGPETLGRCGDRRLGHMAFAQSRRRKRTACDRRARCREHIAYGMPDILGKDRARYAGKTVAVLGAGHSAIGTLTELAGSRTKRPGPTSGFAWQ